MNLPEPEKGYKKHWDIVSSLFYDENFNWPKISIITPSYNQEDLLKEQLDLFYYKNILISNILLSTEKVRLNH